MILLKTAVGQLNEFDYFGDESNGYISKIFDDIKTPDGLILSGKVQKGSMQEPLIIKLNTAGEVIWSTLNATDIPSANFVDFSIEPSDDGYIYGVSRSYSWPSAYKLFWKVNAENGAVEWVEPFYGIDNSGVAITDYDSSRFLICYFNNADLPSMAFVSKTSGDTLATKSFSNTISTALSITTDPAGNILFSRHGTLFKYNGEDWNQEIWSRQYASGSSEINWIDKVYVDRYGDIYVFGRNGGSDTHGNGIIVRVNPFNGLPLWYVGAAGGDVSLADFVDKNGVLIATYRHTLVGGGTYYFRTSKVRKSDGYVHWASTQTVTPLGSTSGTSGNGQSAMSIDVDCSGNIYQTGYYGDANYGPEQWGIMKNYNTTGSKFYDLTIAEDSAFYDNLSVGMVSAVFLNTPIFIGNVEYVTDSTKALFIALVPATGQIAQRKFLGGDFMQPSETQEIVNDGSHVYALKQHGEKVLLEKNGQLANLIWDKQLTNSSTIKAGRLDLHGDFAFVTTLKHSPHDIVPYYTDSVEQIDLFAINKSSSDIVFHDSIVFAPSEVRLIESEMYDDTAFIFYTQNGNVYFERWADSDFSGAQLLEPAGYNMNYDGHLDLVFTSNDNNLMYIGESGLLEIDRQTLAVTSVYSFPENIVVHDHLILMDKLYIGGNSLDDSSIVILVNLTALDTVWMNKCNTNGSIFQLAQLQDTCIISSGKSNGHLTVNALQSNTGNINWTYYKDSITYPLCQPYTLTVCDSNKSILAGGAMINGTSSDVILDLLSFEGDSIETFRIEDDLLMKSRALTSTLVSDSIYWIGGGLNTVEHMKNGFIYHLGYIDTNTNLTINSIEDFQMNLYPNPTQDRVFINIPETHDLFFEVYDLQGKLCNPLQHLTNEGISLEHLKDGIYVVKVLYNETWVSVRVVKT